MEFRITIPQHGYLSVFDDIVDADIPLLIRLEYIESKGLLFENMQNKPISTPPNWELPISRMHGHLFIEWNINVILGTKLQSTARAETYFILVQRSCTMF